MGLLIRPRAATYKETEGWFADWLRGGVENHAGVNISERTAMGVSTIAKGVRARGEAFAMLPKKVHERIEVFGRSSSKEAPDHKLYKLIHTSPNPMMDSMQFFELVSADLDLWGNHYSWIERGSATGRVVSIWRLAPHMVTIEQSDSGTITYLVRDDKGKEQRFSKDAIWHICGLGYDGIRGYSPIRLMMRESAAWNVATARYGAQFFKSASRPSFLAIAENPIKDKTAKEELVKNLTMSGKKSGQGLLVEGALKYQSLTMPQDEAQFIETMQFQEEDLAGLIRVPPHKIGILRRATNNNIEHQDIEWIRDYIQPICRRVEQAFNVQLLSDFPSSGRGGGTERERYFMECELKGFLRGDTAAQTAHVKDMMERAVYNRNDAREFFNLSPVEDGDRFLVNGTYTYLDRLDEAIDKQTEPTPAPEEKETAEKKPSEKAKALHPVFRDAVGRLVSRDKNRERYVEGIFTAPLTALGALLAVNDPDFMREYTGALSKRVGAWEETDADRIATEELERAISALDGRTACSKV